MAIVFFVGLLIEAVPRYLIRVEPLSALIQGIVRSNFPMPSTLDKQVKIAAGHSIISVKDYISKIPFTDQTKKNVIVILVESLRPDQLESFSGNEAIMENVDWLASQSILFTDMYSQSAHTTYANPAVFSSQYPLRSSRTHFYPKKHAYPRLFIYDLLKAWGYKTAIFSSQDEDWGNMSGFMKTKSLDQFFHSGNFTGDAYVPTEETGFVRWLQGDKLSGNIDDRITVGAAIDWMDSLDDTPFFIYMNLQNSHAPYVIPRDFSRRKSIGGVNFEQKFLHPNESEVAQLKARYSDSLSYVDLQIGKVIQSLKEKNRLQNTIIVIAGDNGESFFEHGSVGHLGPLYEESVRTPVMFYVPGLGHKLDNRPAMHIDIVPSLLHLLGLPEHPGFQGKNLFANKYNPSRPRFLVSQSPFAHQYAIVKEQYKLIWTPHIKRIELYDLKRDPREQVDLSKQDLEKRQELAVDLSAWIKLQISYYEDVKKFSQYYPPDYTEVNVNP